jgi:uncharacterized protein
MKLETDLARIAKTARRKEAENWRFQSFLKNYDGTIDELDKIVHDLYQQVSSRIDCRQCANCCHIMQPSFTPADLADFSQGLGLEVNQFKEKYLVKDEETPDLFRLNALPCPFLSGNLCLNYAHRPQDCRSFPHLHKPHFSARLMGVIENSAVCPLVFNVYEQLKKEIWTEDGRRGALDV